METSSPFEKNLSAFGPHYIVNDWNITGYEDILAEKRYLSWRFHARPIENVDTNTVRFRLRAASQASAACLPVTQCERNGPVISLLTAPVEPSALDRIPPGRAMETIRAVCDILDAFDRHALCAWGLSLEWLWYRPDGRLVLAPPAYCFVQRAGSDDLYGSPDERGWLIDRTRTANRAVCARFVHSLAERVHEESVRDALAELETALASEATQWSRVREWSRTGAGDDGGKFGRGGAAIPGSTSAPESDLDKFVAQATAAVDHASLVTITGEPGSGRTTALEGVLRSLTRAGYSVAVPGEVPNPGTKRGPPDHPIRVLAVDDVEMRRDTWLRLLEQSTDENKSRCVVWTSRHAVESIEMPSYLRRLATRAVHGIVQVELPCRASKSACPAPGERSGNRPGAVYPEGENAAGTPSAIPDDLAELELRVLDICAVASRPLPLPVISTAFGEETDEAPGRLQRLAARGLLRVSYSSGSPVTAVFSIPSESLRTALYERIPEIRRHALHRTIARLARDVGAMSTMDGVEHLVRGQDYDGATRAAAAFVDTSTRSQRLPYHDVLLRDVVRGPGMKAIEYSLVVKLRVRLASDLVLQGQHAAAEEILLPLRTLDASLDEYHADAPLISEAMRLLADVWAARSLYRQALELLVETRDDLSSHLALADQARLMNDIGWLHYRLGEYERAANACRLSLNSLSVNKHPLVVGQALNLMGVVCFNTSRYDDAISYYEKAVILREKKGDRNGLAGSYNNMALAYQARGEYDKAIESYDRSLAIKKAENNEAGIAAGFLNQALLHLEVHNFDEAERKCHASLKLAVQLGIEQLTAENYRTLGDIAYRRERFSEAETYYRKSLALASSLETANEELNARRHLARLFLDTNRSDEATELIDTAANLADRLGSRYESAQVDDLRGDACVARNDSTAAIEYFESAARHYADASKFRDAAKALARAGLAHNVSGEPDEARLCLDRAEDMIKADIGREVPDEIVTLRKRLKNHQPPPERNTGAPPVDHVLHTFFQLGAVSEQAGNRNELMARIVRIFVQASNATGCYLILGTDADNYLRTDGSSDAVPVIDPRQRLYFTRVLDSGNLSTSNDAESVDAGLEPPDGNGFICVPMVAAGVRIGCAVVFVPHATLPIPGGASSFYTSVGQHAAAALRLAMQVESRPGARTPGEQTQEPLVAPVAGEYRVRNLIGKDEAMKKVFRTLEKVKDVDTGILIIGESGTGKTELARTIHQNSVRSHHHFQQIHCAEIPINLLESELFGHERGAFTGAMNRKLGRCEIADGGTIFLDDVNVMPMDTQAKLLHYLESKSFTRLGGTHKIHTDVRIIAASNENLEALSSRGLFREDLFYRLRVLQIDIPPLRKRPDDLAAISREYLKRRCHEEKKPLKTLATETIRLFRRYTWPGNVRELQNVLEQIVLLCDQRIVEPASLPEDFLRRASDTPPPHDQSVERLVEQIVETGDYSAQNPLMPRIEAILARRMAQHVANKTRAARFLGITKPTLYSRIRNYNRDHRIAGID